MKSERRHELETNSLAMWLWWRAPELWAQYGTRILTGLVLLAAIFVIVRWRINAPKQAALRAEQHLTEARQNVSDLDHFRKVPGEASGVPALVQKATEESDRPEIQGRAYTLLGDYYWALFKFPVIPEAATQPALRPDLPADQLLNKSQEAYELALKQASNVPDVVASARMSLGAIAVTKAYNEDRKLGEKADPAKNPLWTAAREHYQAVIDTPGTPVVLKEEAKNRIEQLTKLQKPVWLVPATMPAAIEPTGPLGPTAPTTQQAPTTVPTKR